MFQQIYRHFRSMIRLVHIIPFQRICSGEAWKYQLRALWNVIIRGEFQNRESSIAERNRFARNRYSLPEFPDARSGRDSSFRRCDERSLEVRMRQRRWVGLGLGERSMSWGELVHLGDEKYQDVLKQYNNRVS